MSAFWGLLSLRYTNFLIIIIIIILIVNRLLHESGDYCLQKYRRSAYDYA